MKENMDNFYGDGEDNYSDGEDNYSDSERNCQPAVPACNYNQGNLNDPDNKFILVSDQQDCGVLFDIELLKDVEDSAAPLPDYKANQNENVNINNQCDEKCYVVKMY